MLFLKAKGVQTRGVNKLPNPKKRLKHKIHKLNSNKQVTIYKYAKVFRLP
jgi:hypothetical protein